MAVQAASSLASELRLPARPCELALAREYAEAGAAAFGLQADDSYDFIYAVNEAVTNAIRHGSPDSDGQIALSLLAVDDRLTFTVRDYGTFLMPDPLDPPRLESGRGFALMAQLVDDVRLQIEPGGTTVTLSKARE